MDYFEAIEYILALPDMERFAAGSGGHTMSLEAMKAVLARLGNPERSAKTVHITGSKGKGSTSTFIASILDAAGYRTSLYTSPHLHEYTERIKLAGKPVSQEDFARGIDRISLDLDEVNQGDLGPCSTFGAMNALFFHLSREKQVDWQVVEVGLGGLHDGTNVFAEKEVAVITSISLEHTQILGDTHEAIAENKCGIITPGCTVVLAPQKNAAVKKIVARHCQEKGAKLVDVQALYQVTQTGHTHRWQEFSVSGPAGTRPLKTSLLGVHQIDNALTAVACAEALIERGHEITDDAIARGLTWANIAGRVETLDMRPLIIADGAHNDDSAQALVDAVRRHFSFSRCFLIIGTNADKDAATILARLKALSPHVLATRSENQRALLPEALLKQAQALQLTGQQCETVAEAVAAAQRLARPEDLICITGSLYVVAEARELLLAASETAITA